MIRLCLPRNRGTVFSSVLLASADGRQLESDSLKYFVIWGCSMPNNALRMWYVNVLFSTHNTVVYKLSIGSMLQRHNTVFRGKLEVRTSIRVPDFQSAFHLPAFFILMFSSLSVFICQFVCVCEQVISDTTWLTDINLYVHTPSRQRNRFSDHPR